MRSNGWADLYGWELDRGSDVPLFRQIFTQVRTAILAGALKPDTKLPSSRAMAERLGVARTSVVAAFDQLLAEGYVQSRRGSGTFVRVDLLGLPRMAPRRRKSEIAKSPPSLRMRRAFQDFERATVQAEARPFNTGRTLMDARTVETWRKITNQVMRSPGNDHLGYTDPRGLVGLRQSLCDYLRAARAVRCDPEQVIVTSGTQHAIDLAIRVLLEPDDEVWIEEPGYPLTHAQLVLAKMRPSPIPVDPQGIVVDAGIRIAPRARAAFITPSHQFPIGVVLSMARRLELLSWARDNGAFIIEDDYTSEFRYSGPPLSSLQGLDDGARVIYIGTLNKALFPGLRLGYVVVPHALLPLFLRVRYLIDRQPPSLQQAVVAEFMRQGYFAAHIRRRRNAYCEQRDALVATLKRRAGDSLKVDVPDQGMHLVAYLAKGFSDTAIESEARQAGIVVHAISRFYRSRSPRSGLMLGFSGFPQALIVPAAARLGALIARRPRHDINE